MPETQTQRIVTIQPAMGPDFKKPYPFYIRADGSVDRQDFWKGDPARLIGFTDRLDNYDITLPFADFWADPAQAEGKYAVFADDAGDWSTHISVISSAFAFEEKPRPAPEEGTG